MFSSSHLKSSSQSVGLRHSGVCCFVFCSLSWFFSFTFHFRTSRNLRIHPTALFFFFFLDVFSLWSNSRVDSLEVPFHRSQKHKRRSFLSLLDHYPESSSRLPSLRGIEMEKEVGPDVIQTWGWRKSSVFMPLESASVRPLNPCEQWRFCSLRKFWIFSSC